MSLLNNILLNGSNSYRAQVPLTTFNVGAPQSQETNPLLTIGLIAGTVASIASLF